MPQAASVGPHFRYSPFLRHLHYNLKNPHVRHYKCRSFRQADPPYIPRAEPARAGPASVHKSECVVRNKILSGCLGFLCVGWLAGCGFFESSRQKTCSSGACGQTSGTVVRKKSVFPGLKADTQVVSVERSAKPTKTIHVVNEYRGPIESVPIKSVPIESKPIETARAEKLPEVMPEIPALPMPIVEKAVELAPVIIEKAPIAPVVTLPKIEPARKSDTVTVKSVHIQFGHSANFDTVTGQVSSFRKTWRLRYASIEQEDRYGGTIVLEGGADLNQLKDGQHVRIRGTLVAPTERNAQATYRVQAIEILD